MSDNENAMPSIVTFSTNIAEAEALPPIPAGIEYLAQIKDVEVALSQKKGTRYAAVTFYIAPEQLPADFPADLYPDGVTLVYRMVSLEDNPASRRRLRKFCEAIGAPMSTSIDVSEWVGLEGMVKIGHETFEGEPRHVITGVKPTM